MLTKHKYKSGFTLLELAIALTIIGFILGSVIYSGSATLGSSKVTKTISIISDLSIALIEFKSKFKDFPGDININATTPEILNLPPGCVGSGGGDGVISGTYGAGGKLTGGEAICVPEHLFHAGMIRSDETDADTGMLTIKTPYGDVNVLSKASSHAAGVTNFNNRNVVNVIELANLPCEVIVELDAKIDNNDFKTGNAVAANSSSTAFTSCTNGDVVPFYIIAI